ncbi:F-box only protein 30 isoform X1 [Patella vulgata]|uniref:F-box only protein 30 isoform X1 n=1 Tax=Patella vulgata TaxID=6465 RepID=UPI00217FC6DC|nr:F-box only protein 30 isoform X1 [Patella vulgata]
MDVSEHEHCRNCLRLYCTWTPNGFDSCQMVDCNNGCGARYHQCKQNEHNLLCLEERVACINKEYGCRTTMARSKLGTHLEVCPASVLCCPLEWNRWPLHSQEKGFKMAIPSNTYPVQCGQLDVALALRDQRMLIESFKAPSRTQNILRNNLTRKYPAAPIHRCCSIESDDFPSEDTSYGVSDDDDAPWKLGRMPPGLQRSICNKLYQVAKQTTNPLTVTLDLVTNNPNAADADVRKHVDIHISESDSSDRSRSASVEFHPSDSGVKEDNSIINNIEHRNVELHDILGVDLTIECISKYKSKPSSMYTFLCAQYFRRDEFSSHTKNVHNDIQSGLNGMLEHRCPLAYLGCTYTFRKLRPKSDNAYIVHSALLESFGLRYKDPGSVDPYLCNARNQDQRSQTGACSRSRSRSGDKGDDLKKSVNSMSTFRHTPRINTGLSWNSAVEIHFDPELCPEDHEYSTLLNLPFEILQHIARGLDSFSICNLSLTCCLLRDVCCSLLDERGIVVQLWEKKRKQNGEDEKVTWKVKNNSWSFSTAFTPIDSWEFTDHPTVSDHLKTCQYNKDKLKWNEKFSILPHNYVPMDKKLEQLLFTRLRESVSVQLQALTNLQYQQQLS